MTEGTPAQRALARLRAALAGAGLERIPGARAAYGRIHRLVFPGGERRIVVHGMPIWVDTRDRVIATQLLGGGAWEPSETSAFLAHVRRGMCVLDVGANLGYYTLLAARAVGPSGRVIAFEPEPRNFALLARNVAENGFTNVRLVQAAASNRAGLARLHLDEANFGAHSFEAGSVRTPSGRSVEVETVPLDAFADEARSFEAGILVKIDVQGAEALVLEGMPRLLALPGIALLLELWPEALARANADAGSLLAALESLGFTFEDLEAPDAAGQPLSPADVLAACRGRSQAWIDILVRKPVLRGSVSVASA